MKYLFAIILCLSINSTLVAQARLYDKGSRFSDGFARLWNPPKDFMTVNPKQYYIDTTGTVVFNEIVHGKFYDPRWIHSGSERFEHRERMKRLQQALPKDPVIVRKGDKYGALTENGQWLLKPVYTSINYHSDKNGW